MNDSARYLDPGAVARLSTMHIRAQTLMEGIIAGLHRSPHHGGSVEFAEYMEYSPGHEIRHIDWKVYAKSDRFMVKQFEDETNLRAFLVLDGSGSMRFQSELSELTKLQYISFLSATLAYLFVSQGDAVGALAFDESSRQFLPASARRGHLDDLFHLLDNLPGEGRTSMAEALRTISERARGRCMILVFSDMLGADEEVMNLLQVLRSKRNEIVVFHTLDPAEVSFPYEGMSRFQGMEGEGELLVDPDDIRATYLERIRAHLSFVEAQCQRGDVGYVRFETTESIEAVALRFLQLRVV